MAALSNMATLSVKSVSLMHGLISATYSEGAAADDNV